MGVQALLALVLNLRDLSRGASSLAPRERQMARIARRYGMVLLLKTASLETLRRHGGLIVQIAALATLAGLMNWWIFTLEG